ncbi:MAG TPA: TIGR03016 family PEP-CTERM system-associated outer membrane protein, partial [Duganella sp.]|nr:TIGR03016 family PEP-CTERM system-associated outer membrane protein [Duganella sp.]
SPRLQLLAAYEAHLYAYSRDDPAANQSLSQQFNGKLHAEAVPGLLYLDAAGAYRQQAVSAFGPPVADNTYLTENSAKVKTYSLSPYVTRRFGSLVSADLRYTHDVVSADSAGFNHSKADSVQASLGGEVGARIGWGMQYYRQRLEDGVGPTTISGNLGLNGSYQVATPLRLTASIGRDQYRYESQAGDSPTGKSWSAGFGWTPSSRTSVSASVGKRYFGDSYHLDAVHRTRATAWSVRYATDVTTSRDQFLLPASVSTFDLLDRMYAGAIPDPARRRQAVDAFIRANGLPRTLTDSVNYLSNRYILQKQFSASMAWTLAHSVLVLSVTDERRNALSSLQSDSTLLGSRYGSLNDNSHQRGGSATFNYRLSPRSSLNLSANFIKADSLVQAATSINRAYRLALSRQLGRQLNADLELRRQTGSVAGAGGGYRENAIVFHLNQRF